MNDTAVQIVASTDAVPQAFQSLTLTDQRLFRLIHARLYAANRDRLAEALQATIALTRCFAAIKNKKSPGAAYFASALASVAAEQGFGDSFMLSNGKTDSSRAARLLRRLEREHFIVMHKSKIAGKSVLAYVGLDRNWSLGLLICQEIFQDIVLEQDDANDILIAVQSLLAPALFRLARDVKDSKKQLHFEVSRTDVENAILSYGRLRRDGSRAAARSAKVMRMLKKHLIDFDQGGIVPKKSLLDAYWTAWKRIKAAEDAAMRDEEKSQPAATIDNKMLKKLRKIVES